MAASNSYKDYLLSIFILLLLLNPLLCFSHEIDPYHHEFTTATQTPKLPLRSPLEFLKTLVRVRKGSTTQGISDLKGYLSTLGYMETNNGLENQASNNLFEDKLESALKKYQTFFNLETTGILDAHTMAQLELPRCGVPDFGMLNEPAQSKGRAHGPKMRSLYSFFPGAPKWPPTKHNLTYSFPQGTRLDVFRPIRYSLDVWANVTGFTFNHIDKYDEADIKISFEVGDHGDGFPFDGPKGKLAHGFPPTDGIVHFDGSENWFDGVKPDAYDLQTIGMHELGHVLGLYHSTFSGALMYPTLTAGTRKTLAYDDIVGIRTLYGLGP